MNEHEGAREPRHSDALCEAGRRVDSAALGVVPLAGFLPFGLDEEAHAAGDAVVRDPGSAEGPLVLLALDALDRP
eukprot:13228577-Heterocapsa_arctica.AAC.1